VGAPRDDDADFVAGTREVLDDDETPGRMPHAFADHAVENAHRGTFARERARAEE